MINSKLTLLGGLVDKDVNQTHISCERAVEQKLVKSEIGDGVPQKTRRMRKTRRRHCQRRGARTFEDTVGVRGDISRDKGWRWVFVLPLIVLTRVVQYKIFLLESRHLKKVKGERKRVKWQGRWERDGGWDKVKNEQEKKSKVAHMRLAVAIQSPTVAPMAWSPPDAKCDLCAISSAYLATSHTIYSHIYGSKVHLLLLQVQCY